MTTVCHIINTIHAQRGTIRWVNTACAHLTPYIHAKERGYTGFWGIDADDTVFYAPAKVCATLLKQAEKYAINEQLNVFSLDMWFSYSEKVQLTYCWTFGVAFSNLNAEYIEIVKEFNNLLDGKLITAFKSQIRRNIHNMDTIFSILIQMGFLKASTFCFEGLWFEHIIFYILRFGRDTIENYFHQYGIKDIRISDAIVKFNDIPLAAESTLNLAIDIFGVRELCNSESYILFGCGGVGHELLELCRQKGINVLHFCDNNSTLWGKEIDGIKIISPQKLPDIDATVVVAAKRAAREIREQLNELGIKSIAGYRQLLACLME